MTCRRRYQNGPENRLPSSIEEGTLGLGPSGGGCRLTTKAVVRSHQQLRTTPTTAAGCCLPLLVQGGERRYFHFGGAAEGHAWLFLSSENRHRRRSRALPRYYLAGGQQGGLQV